MKKLILATALFALSSCGLQTPIQPSSRVSLVVNDAYYIDCSATSNGTGSQTSPFNSFSAVNATTFASGDSILLKRGTTCSGKGTLHPLGSGTSSSPITISAYGAGTRPHISSGNNTAILLLNQEGWVIQDVRVSSSTVGTHDTNTQCTTCYAGISINSTDQVYSYFRISGVEADGNFTGIKLGNYKFTDDARVWVPDNDQGALQDIIIDGVLTHDNAGAGISLLGNYEKVATGVTLSYPRNEMVSLRNSTVYNNGEDGAIFTSVNNSWIYDNIGYNNGALKDERYTFWYWNSKNVYIQRNEAYEAKTPGTKDGGAYDCDWHVENCTVEYNYSHDNQGPMVLMIGFLNNSSPVESLDGCTVRYNVSQNDVTHPTNDYGAITFFGSVKNCKVYNNTVYFSNNTNPSAVGIKGTTYNDSNYVFGSGSSNTVRNNLIYLANGAKGIGIGPSYTNNGNTYDNDLFYAPSGNAILTWNTSTYNTVSSLCVATGQECSGVQGNPQLSNAGSGKSGYTLGAGSAAINAGSSIDSPSYDNYGNAAMRGPARDIGAFESSNWLKNPGAEVGYAQYWDAWGGTSSGATFESWNIYNGNNALYAGPNNGLAQNLTGFTVGATYVVSGHLKVYSAAGTAVGFFGLKSTAGTVWGCSLVVTNTAFSAKTQSCTIPSGVTAVSAYFWADTDTWIWADDLEVKLQ